jgi:predicted ABC-class ATPase
MKDLQQRLAEAFGAKNTVGPDLDEDAVLRDKAEIAAARKEYEQLTNELDKFNREKLFIPGTVEMIKDKKRRDELLKQRNELVKKRDEVGKKIPSDRGGRRG